MRTAICKISFGLALAISLTPKAFAQFVFFANPSIYAHESAGSVMIGVSSTGGLVNATVGAHPSSGLPTPNSTAILFQDYTTNSQWASGAYGWGAGANPSFLQPNNNTVFFTIPLLNNHITSERVIQLFFFGGGAYTTPSNCVVTLVPDPEVTLAASQPQASQIGPTPGQFTVTRFGDTVDNLTVNFTKGGTATYSTDYTLSGNGITSTSVVIPAGQSSTAITVSPVVTTNVGPDKTVILSLVSGTYTTNLQQTTATVLIANKNPLVNITATDPSATEGGDSGLFTITRTADPSLPLTVYYTIGGTAANSVDYALISNSVTIPAGQTLANITIAPTGDILTTSPATVSLTLTPTNTYFLGASNTATVSITNYNDAARPTPNDSYQPDPNASHGRFVRGSGTNAAYWSFVVPVDLEKGIALDNIGGNATNLFPSIPWATTLNHYNATNTGSSISFQNPIAAFGSRVGGTPLYYGKAYTFGIYAGDPSPTAYTNANSYTNALRINVYQQGTMAFVGTISIPIPNPAWTNDWTAFLTNGYTKTVTAYGLTTILTFNQANLRVWDVNNSTSQNDLAYHVIQTAAQGATNYVYEVELAGGISSGWMVTDGSGARSWSRLYTMEFEQRPPWRATVVTAPAFQGVPMPPSYIGMSPDELATNSPPVTNAVTLGDPTNFLALDQSPELRRNPILDQFVANMDNDPILLANYVLNEIELTDAIDYNDNGSVSDISVNEGGVSRGAYGVFLEKQGSPIEQCALLVYLLRQAGVPAVYEFPPQDGLLMTDSRLSTLLRLQIRGAVNNSGNTYTTNRLIPVNYPWVAAYIGTNWVHIFPWLKDTEVTEGFDLNSYLPAPYNTPYAWVRQYILGATNILNLSHEDDTPATLFPLWLKQTLNQYAPGMSLDDFGMRFRNRPQYRSRWRDFPTPTYVTNYSIAVDTLSSWGITNVNPALTNIFDIVNVTVKSVANPSTSVTSGDLNMAELNDRRFLIRHDAVDANNTRVVLSLEPFRTNVTKVKAFSSVTQTFPPNTNALCYLQSSNTLGASDDQLEVIIAQKFHRALPSTFTQPSQDNVYFAYSGSLTITNIRNINKGDLAAICLDVGHVTQDMLNVHAQKIWQMEQDIAQHPAHNVNYSSDEYQGEVSYLMGMSYFEKCDAFREFTAPLYKAKILHMVSSGLAGLIAKRDQNGLLPNGDVILVQPKVDMLSADMAIAGWGTYHLESGDYSYDQSDKWFPLGIVENSSEEHHVLNTFFKQSDSISTIKLLRLAQYYNPNGIVEMNRYNYVDKGNTVYSGTALKNADPGAWTEVTSQFAASYVSNDVQVFMTPGSIRNLSGSYLGVGTLILSPLEYAALISPNNLNGGWGETMPDASFTQGNLADTQLAQDPNQDYTYDTAQGATTNLASATTPSFDMDNTAADINSGTDRLDPYQTNEVATYKAMSGDTATKNGDLLEDTADTGAVAQQVKPGSAEAVSDPVNSITGDFYVDDTDLTLPGPMPLQIRRNYSSINVFDNSLGYGWKISYFPYLTFSLKATNIFCSEPDGTVVNYRRTTTNANVYLPQFADNPRLQNVNGSIANIFNGNITETVVSGTTNYLLSLPDGSTRLYVVRKDFEVSSALKRWRPYLDSWTNSSGNFLKFSYGADSSQTDYGQVNRVEANNGNFITLQYDVNGHITDIMTGDGRHVQYDYDSYGDLTTVTRPDASQIQYQYQHLFVTNNIVTEPYSSHLLTDVINPGGRVTENVYDAQRRVIQQSATVGYDLRLVPNATFVYANNFYLTNYWTNFIKGSTFIFDCYSNLNQYYYTNSLLCKSIDPLNRTNIQTWYTNGDVSSGAYPNSLKTTIDPRGLVTTHYYDSFGNPTNVTVTGDLTGNGNTEETATVTTAYNSNLLVTNVVDAVGNRIAYTYTNGSDPYLPTTEERYASNGTQISVTAYSYGNVTNSPPSNFTNFVGSFGLLQRVVRAAGTSDAATNDLAYDVHGFPIERIQYSGKGDPDITNYFYYDLRGELVERDDNDGRSWFYTYDGMGRPESREVDDEYGNLVSLESSYYNENGELEWKDGSMSNPEDYVFYDYDGAGRKVQEVHWRAQAAADGSGVVAPTGDAQFATSFFEYDPFGNLIKTIDPRGNYQRMSYDDIGELVKSISYDAPTGQALATNGFAYEPGGKIAYATNGLGGVTAKLYTTSGKLEFQSNPDGSTNHWTYYLDGRVRREYQRNGAFWETTYDDANRTTTKIYYSAALTPLETNVMVADRRGNIVQRTDAAGNMFTSSYDGLDRLKAEVGPQIVSITQDCGMSPPPCDTYDTNIVQQAVTNFYDLAGINVTNENVLGERTVTTRDVLGRVTLVQTFGANSTTPVRVSQNTYSDDLRYVTNWQGSSSQMIPTVSALDNDGHPVLTLRYPDYPTTDVIEFTLQTYDLAGNRIQSAQCSSSNGVVTVWSTNAWSYDGLNRVSTQTTRDGANTSFGYDALGDMVSRSMPGSLSWNAGYNSAGQITSENDQNGVQTTRNTTYTYYPSGSAFAGLLDTVTDNRGVTRTNSYDDYLRVASATTTGSLAEQKMSCSWQYDVRGFLTNVTQSFATNTTGPTTTVDRQYDAYGQLISESVSPGYSLSQGWDAAGRRTQSGSQSFQYRADGRIVSVDQSTFGYGDNGLLTAKTNGLRIVTVDERDGEGKPLQRTTKLNSSPVLTENWSWTPDDLPSAYTAARSDFTDARKFAYGTASRRLTQEIFNLSGTQAVTNNYTYDNGAAGGLGVLTKAATQSANSWSGNLDSFSRVATETNSIIHRTASGFVNGAATLRGYLNGQTLNLSYDPHSASTWLADVALTAGTTNTLSVYADHPSGMFTTNRNSTFTVASGALDTEQSGYDGAGNVTNRVWKRADGTVVRTQNLTWDAFGDLVKVTDLDATNNGVSLVAVFDGLGRQVQTTETTISNNVALTTNPAPVVVTYSYDPQAEFLIEGITVSQGSSSRQDWFAYGPDISGQYGGMHGVGGLEEIVSTYGTLNTTAVLINDGFGNVLGAITNDAVTWNAARESLYAPVEGYAPPRLSLNAPAYASLGWRTRPLNAAGYVQLGARPYDPIRRAFLAPDPLGHNADPALNTAFGGNPAAFFDADGRDWKQHFEQTYGITPILSYYTDGSVGLSYTTRIQLLQWEFNTDAALDASLADNRSFGAKAANWGADTFLNAEPIQQSYEELTHPDFNSGLGITTFAVAGVSFTANTVDAVANAIPLIGTAKGAAEDVAKLGIKNITKIFAKDAAEDLAKAESKQIEEQIADDVLKTGSQQAGANTTRLGVTRNNPADWRATRDLWDSTGNGEILSQANRDLIANGRTPIVDDAWVAQFPEDAGLMGEKIPMHHIQGTPITVPWPQTRHLDAHMPGGYRYNPGGPGSAAPFYPPINAN